MLLVTLFLLLCSARGQIYSSYSRMDAAFRAEIELAQRIEDYIAQETARLKVLSEVAASFRDHGLAMQRRNTEELLSNPVLVYRTVYEMARRVNHFNRAIHDTASKVLEGVVHKLPSEVDLRAAGKALFRLEDIYLDEADFTNSTGQQVGDALTADEIMDIGIFCYDDEDFYCSLIYLQTALKLHQRLNNTDKCRMIMDYLAVALYEQGNSLHALNMTKELLPVNNADEAERFKHNIQMYERVLQDHPDQNRPEIRNMKAFAVSNYDRLCRQSKLITGSSRKKSLSCYLSANSNPILLLAPAKVEHLHSDPDLYFFHDVLSDNEINQLKVFGSQTFEESEVHAELEKRTVDTRVRSSNTGWVYDSLSPMVLAISRRVAAMTGLDFTFAEPFQVLSYGVGGFYYPHFDHDDKAHEKEKSDFENGNRVATWIFYLNNMEKGGATVFPNIDVTIWPEKGGAAFWWNLYRNGTGIEETLHAACPVLRGYKWVGNKWFHEYGNEFKRPCGLKQSL